MESLLDIALEKGAKAERLSPEEAAALVAADITPDRVHALGKAACTNRQQRFGLAATYICNVHVNPSNICESRCSFCTYSASAGDAHAYSLEEAEIFDTIGRLKPTEAHIVGGLNDVWPYERNLDLVRELKSRFPGLYIKGYTAVEIAFFARKSGRTEEQVLTELKEAGLDAMPGGGAEVFSERLYRQHWPKKISPDRWLEIHGIAHGLGIPTNATLLFGIGDTWEERLAHLLRLRDAQDRSGGFNSFIPLPFQPGQTGGTGPSPVEALAVLALSRLVLDNIPHLKAYWPMTGLETAAAGLSFGADDLDGTISEERIAHYAGAKTPKGLAGDRMEETILLAGFLPVERDGRFSPVNGARGEDA